MQEGADLKLSPYLLVLLALSISSDFLKINGKSV